MSDILTKCSSYHFVHRATCGFQPRSPVTTEGSQGLKGSDKPLHALKHRDKTTALIFVEFCCDEQSALSQHNTAFAYIGVTADGEEASTLRSVLERVERLCGKDLDDMATVNQESCNSVRLFPAVLGSLFANAEFFDFARHVAAAFSDGLAAETTSRGSDLEDLRQREMAGLRY